MTETQVFINACVILTSPAWKMPDTHAKIRTKYVCCVQGPKRVATEMNIRKQKTYTLLFVCGGIKTPCAVPVGYGKPPSISIRRAVLAPYYSGEKKLCLGVCEFPKATGTVTNKLCAVVALGRHMLYITDDLKVTWVRTAEVSRL